MVLLSDRRGSHGVNGVCRLAICLGSAAVAGSVLGGCAKPAKPPTPPPPLVGVVESKRMSVPVMAYPVGTTRALEEVTIRARVQGFLTERHFDEGATVKKGDLLLVIDEVPYKIALESAQAKQAEMEAAVRKAEQSRSREVATAQLALDQAQLSLYQIEEKRSRSLLARNAGTREDLDKSEADRKRIEAQVDADKASLEQAQADYDVAILSTKAQLAATRASVRDAELNLGYCRMVAPINGRIGEAKVKVGNLVGPGQTGGTYSELATIQQLDPMGVDIRISSRYLDRATRLVKKTIQVDLTRPGLDGDQDHPYPGELFFIDNTVDETTSTFLGKARVPNPQGTLLPGEYIKMKIQVDQVTDAVVVPEQAVMETDGGPVVYEVDKDSKVAIQKVSAEQSYEGLRVLTKGLEPGVSVIVEGLQMIRPGMPVKTEKATLPQPVNPKEMASLPSDPKPETPNPAKTPEPNKSGDMVETSPTPGGSRSAVAESEATKAKPPVEQAPH